MCTEEYEAREKVAATKQRIAAKGEVIITACSFSQFFLIQIFVQKVLNKSLKVKIRKTRLFLTFASLGQFTPNLGVS